MARANKGGAAAGSAAPPASEAPAAAAPPAERAAPKPKPAPAKVKEEAVAAEASAAGGGRTTASILEAARASKKLGPISKSELAPRSPAVEEKPVRAKPVVPPMPTKPAYAKKSAEPVSEDRRTVLGVIGLAVGSFMAAGFTAMTATFGLWGLGFARYMFPNILTEPPSQFKVGFPAEFPPGTVDERYKAMFGVWVVNAAYGGQTALFALSTVCTHLGCTPNWLEAEQKFKCPCHGSGFYIDGINFEGPAPRPLERYAIRIADDGQLEVDKSRIFQEEKGEWGNPDSFVPV